MSSRATRRAKVRRQAHAIDSAIEAMVYDYRQEIGLLARVSRTAQLRYAADARRRKVSKSPGDIEVPKRRQFNSEGWRHYGPEHKGRAL